MVIILPIIVCTLSAGKEAKNHFLTFLFWTVISYFQKEYLSSPLPSLGRFLTHMFHDLYSINSSTIIAEKCTGDACFTYRQHFEAGKGFMNCPESGALFNYLIWTVTGSSNQILSRGVNTEPKSWTQCVMTGAMEAAGSPMDGALEKRFLHFDYASQ